MATATVRTEPRVSAGTSRADRVARRLDESWILRTLALLLLTCGAFAVLGYHPGIEDDTTYLSALEHDLNPALYPHDLQFVTVQLQLSLFDNIVAESVRLTHLSLPVVALLWQFGGLFGLMLGCWEIVSRCYREPCARWAGVSFVAVMLAMPVSLSELFLADQHLHPRLMTTDLILFAVVAILGRRWWLAVLLLGVGAVFHPLMAAFGMSFCFFLALEQAWPGWWALAGRGSMRAGAMTLPIAWLAEKPTAAWQQATGWRTFLYLYKWPWYGWLTIAAPLALLGWLRAQARRRGEATLGLLATSLLTYSALQIAVALILLSPWAPRWFLQLEPMRFLHLMYLLTALLGAAAFGRWWLQSRAARWLVVFVPMLAVMYVDQSVEFYGSPHIEWPGQHASDPWLDAFAWIRTNTPVNAYFALDPQYTNAPLEGVHSFRALAERSMLADDVKDAGVVTHVPHLAPRWIEETTATHGWKRFGAGDFEHLGAQFGVSWVLVDHDVAGLPCPYHNSMLWVCQVPVTDAQNRLPKPGQ